MKRDNETENDATKIEETIALLAQAVERMGAVPRLSPQARARGIKMRRGGDAVVPTIAAIATKYGIAAPSMSGDTLHAGLAELQPQGSPQIRPNEITSKAAKGSGSETGVHLYS